MGFRNIFAGSILGLGSLALTIYTATEFKPKTTVYGITDKATKETTEVKIYGNAEPPMISGTITDLKFIIPSKVPWFLCLLTSLGYCASVSLLSMGINKDQEDYLAWLAQQEINAKIIRNDLEQQSLVSELQQNNETALIAGSADERPKSEAERKREAFLLDQLDKTQTMESLTIDAQLLQQQLKVLALQNKVAKLMKNQTPLQTVETLEEESEDTKK